jgi:hypothetical protein
MSWFVQFVVRTPQEKCRCHNDFLDFPILAEDMISILLHIAFQRVYHYKVYRLVDSVCNAFVTPVMLYEGYTRNTQLTLHCTHPRNVYKNVREHRGLGVIAQEGLVDGVRYESHAVEGYLQTGCCDDQTLATHKTLIET